MTGVIDGACEHLDRYLTPEAQSANDRFTPCCSLSISLWLVLDL